MIERYIYKDGKKTSQKMKLPEQFSEKFIPELIKRAVLAVQSALHQLQGTNPIAGLRKSTYLSKRRRQFKGTYGSGRSRTPRKVMWRQGRSFGFVGGAVPQTRGGRQAHPPETRRVIEKKMNKKENLLALRSALSATTMLDVVKGRGHIIAEETPFIVEDSVESISKAKDVVALLNNLGLLKELERVSVRKVRAGKGKNRGRRYKNKVGPLIVVSKYSPITRAVKSMNGIDVVTVSRINAELLAPGTHPGRLCIFTKGAIEKMEKENLFR